jgi:hypothetical protein
LSVHLSECPNGATLLSLGGFSRNFIFEVLFPPESLSIKFKFE